MRLIIVGFGAVGGVIGGFCHRAGVEVIGVARGGMYDAVRENGLVIETPVEKFTADVGVVKQVGDLHPRADDVLLNCMKTQHTEGALEEIAAAGYKDQPIVCVQNGVENERRALRRFPNVYGICVMLPATYLEPGFVDCNSEPRPGILDIGRYPTGADEAAKEIAAALETGGFSSEADPDIMRAKYGKLLLNLGNAMQVCCGGDFRDADFYAAVRAEAEAVLRAAGIDWVGPEEDAERRGGVMSLKPIAGKKRQGGSSLQSVLRGTGSVETDYLNGEIVLLARMTGTAAPLNAVLARESAAVARGAREPGSYTADDLRHLAGL